MKGKASTVRNRNSDRKDRYSKMASEGDKEYRNKILSDTLGENFKVVEDNAEKIRSKQKQVALEEKRREKALSKAKNEKERQRISATFGRRSDRMQLDEVKRVIGADFSKNKLEKNGSTANKDVVGHFKHSETRCENPGCERCFPHLSRRRKNESDKQHELRLKGASLETIHAAKTKNAA